jgi:hypothetical protein
VTCAPQHIEAVGVRCHLVRGRGRGRGRARARAGARARPSASARAGAFWAMVVGVRCHHQPRVTTGSRAAWRERWERP